MNELSATGLKLRQRLAEAGFEVTPDELFQSIDEASQCIQPGPDGRCVKCGHDRSDGRDFRYGLCSVCAFPDGDNHPQTAHDAKALARAFKSPTRKKVYLFLLKCGAAGATDDEAQRKMPMNPNSQRPRRFELCEMKLVVYSGRKRKTLSGSPAQVWVLKELK